MGCILAFYVRTPYLNKYLSIFYYSIVSITANWKTQRKEEEENH